MGDEMGSTEPVLVHYRYDSLRRVVVTIFGLIGLASGYLWGGMTVHLWIDFLSADLDWSLVKCAWFHIGLVVPLAFLFIGFVNCTDVIATESGLTIRTAYLIWFSIPWRDVVRTKVLSKFPSQMFLDWDTEERVVSIRKGLTVLHRGLPLKGSNGRQRLRGFVIRSGVRGYRDLVRVIKKHIADN